MVKYVSLNKHSKSEQRKYHNAKRVSWGEVNPVTRKTANLKVYNRKKSAIRFEPDADFFFNLLLT